MVQFLIYRKKSVKTDESIREIIRINDLKITNHLIENIASIIGVLIIRGISSLKNNTD